jgi:5-methylcytosine-specific restriction endonuclease McrA
LRAEFPEPRCAYCHGAEKLLGMPLEVDHIIPEAAGGKSELANLYLCCYTSNGYKWRHIHARDSLTGRQVRILHHPRWQRHFAGVKTVRASSGSPQLGERR